MKTVLSFIAPRNEFNVMFCDVHGKCLQRHTTYNALRAYSLFDEFQEAQVKLPGEHLVALIADDVVKKVTHGELHDHGLGRISHVYRQYSSLTPELREKTRAIWERVDLQGVH